MGTFGKKLWVRVNLTSHSWHSWELSNFSRRITATKRGKKNKNEKMMVWEKKRKDQSKKSVSNLSGRLAGRGPSPETGQRYSGKGEALTDFCRARVRKPLADRQYYWWKSTSFKHLFLLRQDHCVFLSADMLVFKCPWGYLALWDIAWIQRGRGGPCFSIVYNPLYLARILLYLKNKEDILATKN